MSTKASWCYTKKCFMSTKIVMLQVKVFHVDKTKMILHKRIFSAQNSYYFFLERRDILWRWMQISWRQNKQKEKMNQKMKGIFAQFQKINGINKAVIHHNRLMDHIIHHKSMMDQSYILQPIYSKTFGMLNFINKRVRTAVVVAVIAKNK